jgi:hypothetical protein
MMLPSLGHEYFIFYPTALADRCWVDSRRGETRANAYASVNRVVARIMMPRFTTFFH